MKTLNLVLSIPQHQMDIENGGVLRRVLSEEGGLLAAQQEALGELLSANRCVAAGRVLADPGGVPAVRRGSVAGSKVEAGTS